MEKHNRTAGMNRREEEMNIDFYRIYREEMASIPICTKEEEIKLLNALAEGDPTARKRLAEGHLALAVRIAEEYEDCGVPIGDLVQEANMALLLFLEEVKAGFDGEFCACAESRIRRSLEQAVSAQENEQKVEEEMAARVNVLKDISARLAEDLGREPSVKELAEYMKMTEDEIKDIMMLSLNAVSLSGNSLPETQRLKENQ